MYIYETHCHTAESSRCAKSTGAEMVRRYKELGYDGIIVTDHFINGNSTVDRKAPWDQQVDTLLSGYHAAKKEGDEIGLKVFMAWEDNSEGNDFLTYGLSEEWLRKHPEIVSMPIREYLAFVRSEGAFVVHAHPYRSQDYIKCIRLFPYEVDAVEILNLSRPEIENKLAHFFADTYGLPATSGSDSHTTARIPNAVISTETPINSVQDYIKCVVERKIAICNPLV